MLHRLSYLFRGLGRNVFALGLLTATAHAGTIYVNGVASGANNGTSWADAFTDLQSALTAAAPGDDIWVAAGTYKPTSRSYRAVSFALKTGVGVYGGFAGTETLLSERDWTHNVTVLSGDLGTVGANTDNSYHVVTSTACAATAVLDGFTVTGGNANGAAAPDNCGGGMYNWEASSPTLTNCTFSDNEADNCGGGMYNESSSPTLSHCTFTANWASWAGPSSSGGGMYNSAGSSPTLSHCTFTANSAAYGYGGGMFNDESSPTLSNCSFTNNSASGGGGMSNYVSSPTLTNCAFTGNSARRGGGMQNDWYSSPTLSNCSFTGNSAVTSGGGMTNDRSSPTVSDCTFSGNSAYAGGGMCNGQSSPTLNNCSFTNNSAYSGGGMCNGLSSPTLSDCGFSANSADYGGGMYNDESSPTLSDCSFTNNLAYSGGGMYSDESSPTLSDCGFTANSADYGGGMTNDRSSPPTLSTCSFTNNSAYSGGGMHNSSYSSPTLSNCSFTNNSAYSGGGMHNYASSPTLSDCTFAANAAYSSGGGMYNYGPSPTLNNCSFTNNSAYSGGGMCNAWSSSATLTNCTFTANSADCGGGLSIVYRASATLSNCILWADTAGTGAEIFCESDSMATVSYSDVQGGYAGTGNLDADPRFVAAGDCRLQAGSPGIDAANGDVAPPTDILGNARYDDPATPNTGTGTLGYADLGAYEHQAAGIPTGLTFVVQPTSAAAGTTLGAVQVVVQDDFGNTITTATDAITVAIGSNPGGATLAGTLTVNAVAGVATFSDLSIDRAGVGYTLTASASGLAGATSNGFDITPYGPPSQLVFAVQPSVTHAGAAISPAVQVSVADAFGNPVTTATDAITVAIGSNPGGGTLAGTLTVNAVAGFASFKDLSIDRAGSGYTLTANAALLAGATSSAFTIFTAHAGTIYVNGAANGANNGSSWADAFTDLQSALTAAVPGDDIWVAAGTYQPASGSDRAVSFALKTGVGVYGGFAGTETLLSERNWTRNVTVLSGDLGTAGDNTDNSYHVVTAMGCAASAVLDGFVITGGYADGDVAAGGGMYNDQSSPTLNHCTFTANAANSGGGMYNNASSPTLNNCSFTGNKANYIYSSAGDGGGMYNNASSPTLSNCTFTANAAYYSGGGMYNESSSPTLSHCTFTANAADCYGDHYGGGGMYNESSSPTLSNCTFTANSAPEGGGMYNNESSSPILSNCRFTANSAYCGGGMYNESSSPTLSDCTLTGNSAHCVYGFVADGGGMYNDESSPTLSNCTFTANSAGDGGGGMYNVVSSPTLSNCTFTANAAAEGGGGMYNFAGSSPTLTNCILWGDTGGEIGSSDCAATVTYSDVQGGYAGTGNLDADPRFVAAGDCRLQAGSPCIDAANGDVAPPTDSLGHARYDDPDTSNAGTGTPSYADLGAYEHLAAGTPTGLVFSVQPASTVAGTTLGAVQVVVQDDFGNTVTTATGAITVALGSNPGGGTLAGTLTVNAVAGLTSFTDLNINRAGIGYTLTASAAGLAGATSRAFDIVPGPPSQLVFAVQPSVTRAGAPMSPAVQVLVADAFGNPVTTATDAITVGLGANPGGGTLAGTLTVNAVAGVATFSDLSIDRAGVGYTLTASAAVLAGATSNAFDITPYDPPSQLVFAVQPSVTHAGKPISPAVQVLVADAFGNPVTTATDAITVAIGSNPGGGTLAGTLTVNAVAGLATFIDLRIDRIGVGYTLTANAALLAGATSSAFNIFTAHVGTIYVNGAANGANNGSSWAHAFTDLQSALAVAAPGDDIWVAAGTYQPTSGSDRAVSFALKPDVGVYGGFAGTETLLSERNWTRNVTVLSGDLGTAGDNADNSYHVVTSTCCAATAVLDGFTITGGNANRAVYPDFCGGGMYNSVSSPTLTNCTFSANSADYGGGMSNDFSSPTLTNCTFTANSANYCGGGMCNDFFSSPTLSNCTFSANSAGSWGGGMCNLESPPTLSNCTFTANSAGDGGGMYSFIRSSPTLTNCILWGDTGGEIGNASDCTATVAYSDVQGGYAGTGNFDADPRFVGPGDCRLQAGSPCIDAANGDVAPPTDSLGHARYDDPATPNTGVGSPSYVDLGVYEHLAAGTPTGLAFAVQPTSAAAGTTLNAVQVVVQDDFGNTITTATDEITMSIGNNAGGGRLVGTLTVNAVAGVATFGDLRIKRAGVGYTLTASTAGLAGATSSAFNILRTGPIYVKANATGASDGLSWADAYTDLQSALAAAKPGEDIWVAAGTYQPTSGSDRTVSFALKTGVGVYGGFAGTETLLSERNWTRNVTVLSGDLGAPGDDADNSYHVVTSMGCAASAVLDGFSVTGGNAKGAAAPDNCGGGMYNWDASSPTLRNCTFRDNAADSCGGGMYNLDNSSPTLTNCAFTGNSARHGGGMCNDLYSSPTLSNCTFTGNSALFGGGMGNDMFSSPMVANCTFSNNSAIGCGGGMYNYFSSSPTLSNCTFTANFADYGGGGMYNDQSSPTLSNGTFTGNSSRLHGGGMRNDSSSPTLSNCTFTANSAGRDGGGIFYCSSSATLNNCILWGDTAATGAEIYCDSDSTPAVTYSDVQGGYAGTGNLDADPRFVGVGDCRLQAGSPCIDAANGDVAPPTDTLGHARYDDPTTPNTGTGTPSYADLGAYEHQAAGTATGLAFTVQPENAAVGANLGAVQVVVQDDFGNPVTTATDTITLAIGANPGGGTLAGTLTVNAVAGVATFSDLSIDRAGVGYTLTASAAGLAGATTSAFDITPYGPGPHLVVRGQGQDIANGDVTPAVADDTDFGSLRVGGGEHAHTFTILNLGAADLHLTGTPRVTLSGPHPADFLVWVQPGSPVRAGGNTFCIIRFAPTGAGLRSATVTIASDDADENPYTFAIQGTGKKQRRPVALADGSDSGCRLAGPGSADGSLWLSLSGALLALGAARRRRWFTLGRGRRSA